MGRLVLVMGVVRRSLWGWRGRDDGGREEGRGGGGEKVKEEQGGEEQMEEEFAAAISATAAATAYCDHCYRGIDRLVWELVLVVLLEKEGAACRSFHFSLRLLWPCEDVPTQSLLGAAAGCYCLAVDVIR